MSASGTGHVVVLNGAPRAGKTSVARAVQEHVAGTWVHLGVDASMEAAPPHLRPGIGLRPGGERPDLEPVVARLTRALYASVAAHARLGLDVVVDAVHHHDYAAPLRTLDLALAELSGLEVLLVGVRCPVEVVRERRRATWGGEGHAGAGAIGDPVARWERAVHDPGRYDVEVDTSVLDAVACAAVVGAALGREVSRR